MRSNKNNYKLVNKLSAVLICLMGAGSAQAVSITLGDPLNGGGVDSWQAIMVVNENDAYTNSSGANEQVTLDSFNFTVGANRGQVTPFVVKINDAVTNNYTILAIGDTRYSGVDYNATGNFSFDFSSSLAQFILVNGDVIASGFLDATADGVSNGSVIPFRGGDSLFLTGSPSNSGSGNLSQGVGGALTLGGVHAYENGSLGRDYSYNIGATVIAAPVPEPASLALVGLGLFGLGFVRKIGKNKKMT